MPVALVVVVSLIAPIAVHHFLTNGWADFLITSVVAVISVSITVFMIGITSGERSLALSFVRNRIQRLKGK